MAASSDDASLTSGAMTSAAGSAEGAMATAAGGSITDASLAMSDDTAPSYAKIKVLKSATEKRRNSRSASVSERVVTTDVKAETPRSRGVTGLRPPFFAAATSSGASGTAAGARRRGSDARDEFSKIPRTSNVEDVSQVTALAPAPVDLEVEMEDILERANAAAPVFSGGTATADAQVPPVN